MFTPHLSWSSLETSLLEQFALLCSAWESAWSRGLHKFIREMLLRRWHVKKVWVLWKISASAGCSRPWGLSQYPTGHQKTIPDTGGALREGEFFSSAGIWPPACFALHALQDPLGARYISKSPTALVFRPAASLLRSPLCQPAAVKSLLVQARLSWNAKGRAAVTGGTSAGTEKQLEGGWSLLMLKSSLQSHPVPSTPAWPAEVLSGCLPTYIFLMKYVSFNRSLPSWTSLERHYPSSWPPQEVLCLSCWEKKNRKKKKTDISGHICCLSRMVSLLSLPGWLTEFNSKE